jgi:hypothetical protein
MGPINRRNTSNIVRPQPGSQWLEQQLPHQIAWQEKRNGHKNNMRNITSRMGTLSFSKKRKNRKTRKGGGLGFLGKLGAAFGALGVNAKGIRGSATPTPSPPSVPTMAYGNIASPPPFKSNFQVLPNGTSRNVTAPVGGRRSRRNRRNTRK